MSWVSGHREPGRTGGRIACTIGYHLAGQVERAQAGSLNDWAAMIGDLHLAAGDYWPASSQGGQRRRVAIRHDDHFQQIVGILKGQEEHPLAGVGQVAADRYGQAAYYH
jgi:hypothetical protein